VAVWWYSEPYIFVVSLKWLWQIRESCETHILVVSLKFLWQIRKSCKTHIVVVNLKWLWKIRESCEVHVIFIIWKLYGCLVMFWALHFCRKLGISVAEPRNFWDSHSCLKLEIFMTVWRSFKIRMIFAHSIGYTFHHLQVPYLPLFTFHNLYEVPNLLPHLSISNSCQCY
jgi:hypothetical protein